MNKLITTLLVSSLAMGGIAVAHADSEHSGKSEHHGKHCKKGKMGNKFGMRIERMAKKLDFSESQLKQAREIQAKYQPQMQTLYDKKKATRQELRAVMHADNIDQAAVKKLAQQQGDLNAQKIILRSQMRTEINKVLTAEQRTKMEEMRKNRGEKHYGEHE